MARAPLLGGLLLTNKKLCDDLRAAAWGKMKFSVLLDGHPSSSDIVLVILSNVHFLKFPYTGRRIAWWASHTVAS